MNEVFALQNWYKERGLHAALWPAAKPARQAVEESTEKQRLVLFVAASLSQSEKNLLQKIQAAALGSVVVSDQNQLETTDTVISFGAKTENQSDYQCCSLGQLSQDTNEKKKLWAFLRSQAI